MVQLSDDTLAWCDLSHSHGGSSRPASPAGAGRLIVMEMQLAIIY